jgi:hypothetical protein
MSAIYTLVSTDKIRTTMSSNVTSLSIQGSYATLNSSGSCTGFGVIKHLLTTAGTQDDMAGPGSSGSNILKECTWRNTDTSNSTDVSIAFYDGTNTYEKIKATLGPGDMIQYAEGVGFLYIQNTAAVLDKLLFVKGSDVVNSTTTFADITGLTCAVKAGVRYSVFAWLHVISAASTTGVQVGYNLPNGAPTSVEFTTLNTMTSSLTAPVFATGEATARDTAIAAAGTGPTTIAPMFIGGGFVPSADDIFALRLKSEVAASAATVKIHSWLRIIQEH